MIRYAERPPAPGLEPYIECIWSSHAMTDVRGFAVLPDGCMDLLDRRVIGAMTQAMRFDAEAGQTATGVRFRPGILPVLLRIDGGELTDLDCEAPRGLETPDAIEGWVRSRASALDPAQKAVAAIAASRMSIADAAWQANLSERQFRRTCLRLTGLTPKQLSRIARFRGMLSMAPAMLRREETWAAVAAECGYYDQSHLIHDFAAFSGGVTPDRFFQSSGVASSR